MTAENTAPAQPGRPAPAPNTPTRPSAAPELPALALGMFAAGWNETAPPGPPPAESGGARSAWTSPDRTVLLIHTADRYGGTDLDLRGTSRNAATWLTPDWLIALPQWNDDAVIAAAQAATNPAPNNTLPTALMEAGWTCQPSNDPMTGCPMWHWRSPGGRAVLRRGPDCPDAPGGWCLTRPTPAGPPGEGYATRTVPPAVITALILTSL